METKDIENPKLHFVNVNHTPENLPDTLNRIRDCDILFVEAVGDHTKKVDTENLINYGARTADPEEKARVINIIEHDVQNRWVTGLAKYAIDAGKKMYFIDVDNDHEAMAYIEDSRVLEFKSSRLSSAGQYENSLEQFKKHLENLGKETSKRDEYIKEQISETLKANSEDFSNKTIGIIQGATHSSVFHHYKKLDEANQVSRSFLENTHSYNIQDIIIRKIVFGKRVTETEYRRAWLDHFVFVGPERESLFNKINDIKVNDYWNQLISNSTDPYTLYSKIAEDVVDGN